MKSPTTCFAVCFTLTVALVSAYQWVGVTVDSLSWYSTLNIDVTLIGRTELVFAIQGCKGADMIFYEKVDEGKYVYLRIGDGDNTYAVMFSSLHCGDAGCSPADFESAAHLDCSIYNVFWARWDNKGKFDVGNGSVVGELTSMSMDYSFTGEGVFDLRYLKITSSVTNVELTYQFLLDTPPVFISPHPAGHSVAKIPEDSPVGTSVIDLEATDAQGDTVLYGITNGFTNMFNVDYTNADLITNTTFDFEAQKYHTLIVGGYDGRLVTNAAINLEITDSDDNAPVLTVNTGLTIPEELPEDYKLGGFYSVSDIDTINTFTYTITGTDAQFFKVDSSGQIMVKSRIDFENLASSSLTFTFTVTDTGSQSDAKDITVVVTDINDNAPSCDQSVYFVQIEEAGNAVSKILDLVCSDVDTGNNAKIAATISGGNTDSIFSLQNFELHADTSKLDFETTDSINHLYNLEIRVYDDPDAGSAITGQIVVVIEVTAKNEYTPQFVSPVVSGSAFPDLSLDEDAGPGAAVVTVQASDADGGSDGEILYEIVSVTSNTGAGVTGKFYMDPENGELRVAGALDADGGGATYYDVLIKAKDKGSTPLSVQATQRITLTGTNDNPPVFNSPVYEKTLDENVTIGSDVIDIDVTDSDGDTVTLTLSGAWVGYFDVSGTRITVKKAFDYETTTCYNIGISASDGVHVATTAMTVRVNNINDEAPVITTKSSIALQEETHTGTVLYGYYSVVDPDGPDTFSYTLSGPGTAYFEVNAEGNLTIKQRIDRDTMTNTDIQLTLGVEDSAGHQASATFSITITDMNDNIPTCDQTVYTIQVEEEGTESDKLFQSAITCTDADSGNNAVIKPQIQDGDPDGIFTYKGFELWGASDKLDYESVKEYRLIVDAKDSPDAAGRRKGTYVVLVQVTGKNEFTPYFTSPALVAGALPDQEVNEDLAPGSVIVTFAAADDDHGTDGEVFFQLGTVTSAQGTVTGMFRLDRQSGELYLSGSLDSDADTGGVVYYDLEIKVIDKGSPPLESVKTLKVTLKGVNDNAPAFSNVVYDVSVAEDAAMNDVVSALTVTDADGDPVTVTAVAGDMTVFGVVGTDIVVLGALDYETQTCYYLDLRASDGTKSADISVTIKVTDVNDETPSITLATSLSMVEEMTVGTVLHGLYTITDLDAGDTFTFTLAGTDAASFTLNTAGDLVLGDRVDFEAGHTSKVVDVSVSDAGGHSVTETVTITVVDINDNAPKCDQDVYEITVEEGSGADAKLMNAMTCTDSDSGDNAKISLGIANGDPDGVFRFQSEEIWGSADSIDYESLSGSNYRYYLTVMATDQPTEGPVNTGTVLVIIKVTGKNEDPPAWTSGSLDVSGYFPQGSVAEDISVGSTATTFTAEDPDDGLDGEVSYELVDVKTDTGTAITDKFWLHPENGHLVVATELDADASTGGTAFYDITVKAIDKGATPQEVVGKMKLAVSTANDNSPTFSDTSFSGTVAEDAAVDDTVMTLTLDDVDSDPVTLSVVDSSLPFKGQGTSVLVKSALDYETENCYAVQLRASDGVHTTDQWVTIEVTDVSDVAPQITIYPGVTVPEELPVGTIIGNPFKVTDPDDQSFTYSISGSDSSYLNVDASNGHLSVAKAMDRDGSSGVAYIKDLTITVTDAGGMSTSANFRIDISDINDMTPYFSDSVYHATATENSATVKLLTLTCNDDDSGPNGDVTLSIPAADNPGSIFSMTGSDLFADGSKIDLETTASYQISVVCTDTPTSGSANTGATIVQITVHGVNEFDPVLVSPVPSAGNQVPGVTVSEASPLGTLIETFNAEDSDSGPDGQVRYDIIQVTSAQSQTVTGLFTFAGNGKLQTSAVLDADSATGGSSYYDVVVGAVDEGTPKRSTTAIIRVSLTDANDNGPTFSKQLYSVKVQCTSNVNEVIATVAASDVDSATSAKSFSLAETSTKYSIDSSTGDIALLVAPDSLTSSDLRHVMLVHVIDSSNANLNDSATVMITHEYCGTTTTTMTTTTTTEAPPFCPAVVNTEVVVLGALSGAIAATIVAVIIFNQLCLKPPTPPQLPPTPKTGGLEMSLEAIEPMDADDLILEGHVDSYIPDALPPATTIGGRIGSLP